LGLFQHSISKQGKGRGGLFTSRLLGSRDKEREREREREREKERGRGLDLSVLFRVILPAT
jgi:hypothetical protein